MSGMKVTKRNGSTEPLDIGKIHKAVEWACGGLDVSQSDIETEAQLLFFDGIKTSDIQESLIRAATTLISADKLDYEFAAARLLLLKIVKEVKCSYDGTFKGYIELAVGNELLDEDALLNFDLDKLSSELMYDNDLLFDYVGLQTLYDRYLIRLDGNVIEKPQFAWMRVAMGLALNEDDPTERAIEFYGLLSNLEFVSSTPTLFNSCTLNPQLSSCFVNTVSDSLAGIYSTISECAFISKLAGGLGTDWTAVRAMGSYIKGTGGMSSGYVPYIHVYNGTAVAVNQGGKRKGAFAPYSQVWHPDFIDFCNLRKESGDDRLRARDVYPTSFVSDLFMERVDSKGTWSFFDPKDYPELITLHGDEFKVRYEELENNGKYAKQMPAFELWQHMLDCAYETGFPMITFKDETNRRNIQQHIGPIRSLNLCTEITLPTSETETAVCNLGSVNLSRMGNTKSEIKTNLGRVIKTAMRMLDNVIDLNKYPSEKARRSNIQHRPVGLGQMGYAEMLCKLGIEWNSEEHVEFADELYEVISFYAIKASSMLAEERGAYPSYEGSMWSKGIFPIDTARENTCNWNWDSLRQRVARYGVRNSFMLATAPTATIANIAGTTPCIELPYELDFVKENLSGHFRVFAKTVKYGDIAISAFNGDIDYTFRAAAKRQKWIDQSQSLTTFQKSTVTGKALSDMYFKAWRLGLKSTYYLRIATDDLDDSCVHDNQTVTFTEAEAKVCSIDNPDSCEACQ